MFGPQVVVADDVRLQARLLGKLGRDLQCPSRPAELACEQAVGSVNDRSTQLENDSMAPSRTSAVDAPDVRRCSAVSGYSHSTVKRHHTRPVSSAVHRSVV